jgi:hypothetical protein
VGHPLGDLVRSVPYRAVQTLLDEAAAPGNGAPWRSVRLRDLSDTAIETSSRWPSRCPRRSHSSPAGRSEAQRVA